MKPKQLKRNFKKMDVTSRTFIKGASVVLIIQVLIFILHPTTVSVSGIIHISTLIAMFVFKEKSVRMNRYRYYLKGRMKDRERQPIMRIFLN